MSLENSFFMFVVLLLGLNFINSAVSAVFQEDTNYWNTTLISRTESTTTAVAIHQPVAKKRTRISYRADDKFDDLKRGYFSFRKPTSGRNYAAIAGGYYINKYAILTVAKPFHEVGSSMLCFKVIVRKYNYVVPKGSPAKGKLEDVFAVHGADNAEGIKDDDGEWNVPFDIRHHEKFKHDQMDKYNYAVAEVVVIQVKLTSCGPAPEGVESDQIICTEKTAENTVDAARDFGNPLICGEATEGPLKKKEFNWNCVYKDCIEDSVKNKEILGIAIAGDGTENVYLKLEPELEWIKKAMEEYATTIFVDAILREPTKLTMYFFALVFFYQLLN